MHDIQRIDDISKTFAHFPPVSISYHRMQVHLWRRGGSGFSEGEREEERERGRERRRGREEWTGGRRRRREGRPQRRGHVPLSSAQRTPSWQPRRRGCRDQSPVVSWDRRSPDLLSVQVQGREGGREREVTTKAIFTNAGSKVLTGVLWTPHS